MKLSAYPISLPCFVGINNSKNYAKQLGYALITAAAPGNPSKKYQKQFVS